MEYEIKDLNGKWYVLPVGLWQAKVVVYVASAKEMLMESVRGLVEKGVSEKEAERLSRIIHKRWDGREDEMRTAGDSFGEGGDCFIRIDKMRTGNLDDTLVFNHECLHTANRMLMWCGVREDSNIECLCYTHEYVFGKLMEQMCEQGFGRQVEDGSEG